MPNREVSTIDSGQTSVSINTIPHGPFKVGNNHYFVNRMDDVNCIFDPKCRDTLGIILDNMYQHEFVLDYRRIYPTAMSTREMVPLLALLIMSDGDIGGIVQNGKNQFIHQLGIAQGKHKNTGENVFCAGIGRKHVRWCGRWKFAGTDMDIVYQSVMDFNEDHRNRNKIAAYVCPIPLGQDFLDDWEARNNQANQ